MEIKIGDKGRYRGPFSGGIVEATVTAIRDDGTLDLIAHYPGCDQPVSGQREDDVETRGWCWARP